MCHGATRPGSIDLSRTCRDYQTRVPFVNESNAGCAPGEHVTVRVFPTLESSTSMLTPRNFRRTSMWVVECGVNACLAPNDRCDFDASKNQWCRKLVP